LISALRNSFRWLALAVLLVVSVPLRAEVVQLDARAPTTVLSQTFTVSTWPFSPVLNTTQANWFFRQYQPGLIQIDLGNEIFAKSLSREDALARVSLTLPFLKRVEANGGKVMISISKIPPWLSSSQSSAAISSGDKTAVAAASPPNDLKEWQGFVAEVTALFNGLRTARFRIGWEPDTKAWQGSEAAFFVFYDATAKGILQARRNAKIGGPGVSDLGAHASNSGGVSMLSAFISHAGRNRLPLDFVALHAFGTSPWTSWQMYRDVVSGWLKDAGYPTNTPIFVGEWSDSPDPFSKMRERPDIAAYVIANLVGMDRAGIRDHSLTSLTEQQTDERTEFSGGFGLFTKNLAVRPAGMAYHLVDRLGSKRLPVTVRDGTVFAVATRDASNKVSLLLSNYVPDGRIAVKDYVDGLRARGVSNEVLGQVGGSIEGLAKLAKRESAPQGPEVFRRAHAAAQPETMQRLRMWRDGEKSPREITIRIDGLAGRSTDMLQVFRIDSEHGVAQSQARKIDRAIGQLRKKVSPESIVKALQQQDFSNTEIALLTRIVKSRSTRAADIAALGQTERTQLYRMIAMVEAIQMKAVQGEVVSIFGAPATGLTVSQSVSIAGKTSLEFDIRMEPNSVALFEFGEP
jgi:hypothetical protein